MWEYKADKGIAIDKNDNYVSHSDESKILQSDKFVKVIKSSFKRYIDF